MRICCCSWKPTPLPLANYYNILLYHFPESDDYVPFAPIQVIEPFGFPATTQCFNIFIVRDLVVENTETFNLSLVLADTVTIGSPDMTTVTITDEEDGMCVVQ